MAIHAVSSSLQPSAYRTVFESLELRGEFVKFLKTIFYQLDEQKVLKKMDQILKDPNLSDQMIYQQIVANIDEMRKWSPSILHQVKALRVLQKGMGNQAQELLACFRGETFHNYLEIYFRRYFHTIRKTAGLALNGTIAAACDTPYQGSIKERLEAGSLFSSYPYHTHIPLNDEDCIHPEREPEKTHKPLGDEIPSKSIDLIACLGGLHHIPENRTDAFVNSLARKLKPGGVLLLRDHNVTNPGLRAIASVVHSFVNATAGVHWEIEQNEVRNFQSQEYWANLLKTHHLIPASPKHLVLNCDPTQNGMTAFIKEPTNLQELKNSARYRKDSVREADGTNATWLEWGNVRYAKDYAKFVQTKHWYAFPFLVYAKQHQKYFQSYLLHSWKEGTLTSTNVVANLSIFASASFWCLAGFTHSLPYRTIAWLKHGVNWRLATDLTTVEKYEAKIAAEYAEFIDTTLAFQFPYCSKMIGLWRAVWNSEENFAIKCLNSLRALLSTFSLLSLATGYAVGKAFAGGEDYIQNDVSILLHDTHHRFMIGRTIYETPNGHKLILVPRYRLFTQICKQLASAADIQLLEIGCQSKITVDVKYKEYEDTLLPNDAKLLYEIGQVQDPDRGRLATYEVAIERLQAFERIVGTNRIEYVHE